MPSRLPYVQRLVRYSVNRESIHRFCAYPPFFVRHRNRSQSFSSPSKGTLLSFWVLPAYLTSIRFLRRLRQPRQLTAPQPEDSVSIGVSSSGEFLRPEHKRQQVLLQTGTKRIGHSVDTEISSAPTCLGGMETAPRLTVRTS